MPVYSFECKAEICQSQLDAYLPTHSSPFPLCPECGGEMKRIITSAPGFSLKGSCWSGDGYGKTGREAQATSDKANKGDRVVSFPGQRHKGRTGA